MALITISAKASVDAISAQRAGYVSGLFAGENIPALSACRIASNGTVMLAVTTSAHVVSDFAGFAPKAYKTGEPITLFNRGVRFRLADSGLTPGALLYVSATAGKCSDAVVLAGDRAIALVVTATDAVSL
jgi:hypothetical protein